MNNYDVNGPLTARLLAVTPQRVAYRVAFVADEREHIIASDVVLSGQSVQIGLGTRGYGTLRWTFAVLGDPVSAFSLSLTLEQAGVSLFESSTTLNGRLSADGTGYASVAIRLSPEGVTGAPVREPLEDAGSVHRGSDKAAPGYEVAATQPPSVSHRADLYRVWYATNRRPRPASDAPHDFTSERDDELHYGHCDVYVPK